MVQVVLYNSSSEFERRVGSDEDTMVAKVRHLEICSLRDSARCKRKAKTRLFVAGPGMQCRTNRGANGRSEQALDVPPNTGGDYRVSQQYATGNGRFRQGLLRQMSIRSTSSNIISPSSRLPLEVHVGERLIVGVPHDEARLPCSSTDQSGGTSTPKPNQHAGHAKQPGQPWCAVPCD
jgi:hypothetical protein